MKKLLIIIVLYLNVLMIFGQVKDFYINFENGQALDLLVIDTLQYLANTWQMGEPQKAEFGEALSLPNAIVTDIFDSYPINNTSVFTIMDFVSNGYYYGLKSFSGYYYVQSDSLQDYGNIEMSPDNGETWIDILNDTTYAANIQWYAKPILTGNSYYWESFDAIFSDIASLFNLQMGDTVLYRFSFTSDSIFDDLGGLMYDNIGIFEFVEGISETRFKSIKSVIYPNPSTYYFTIDFENPDAELFGLAVYNGQSQLMIATENISGTSVVVDARMLNAGIYFYKLTNHNKKERSWGKFVVAQ